MEQPSKAKRLIHRLMALERTDHTVRVETVPIACPGLPTAFERARVAVVADVHLPDALVPTERLVRCVAATRPDAIFLPGDLTNSYTDFDAAGLARLAGALADIAPCFAVAGNHEWRLAREGAYRRILTHAGITYLCDSYADWHKGGQALRLFGMGRQRPAPLAVGERPAIVLAHRPEYFHLYVQAGWNLVVCGHAHGGHARLGRLALFAPDQGFFPAYTHGVYRKGDTQMAVSRGLGNSSIPWRVNNPPHLPVLLLTAAEKASP